MGEGSSFAESFSRDGELATVNGAHVGSVSPAQFGASERSIRTWITNLAIESSPTGAVEWASALRSRRREFIGGALYRDRWMRTSKG
jgi:hypothetical protein